MKTSPPRSVRSLRIICNERADDDDDLQEAVRVLGAEGVSIETCTADTGEAVSNLAAEAARAGVDAVVAAGGDGTLNDVVNGIYASGNLGKCGIGVLPFGTANDFAVSCGIPVDQPLDALRVITGGQARLIDVGKINDRLFINVATGGTPAEVTTETPPETKRLLGGFAYLLTGLTTVFDLAPQHIHVRADDFDWQGPALALLIANGRQSGGGFQIARQALLDDGLLNLVIIPEISLDRLTALISDWLQPSDDADFEHLIKHEVSKFEIAAPGGFQINLDGEPIQGEFFQVETIAQQLPIYLPPEAPLSVSLNDA